MVALETERSRWDGVGTKQGRGDEDDGRSEDDSEFLA